LLFTLAFVLGAATALAAGRLDWKSKEFQEREGGSWRIELAIHMPSAPDVAHVPMKFEFQPIAYYERSMMDGDKLVERTVPLENRQSLIESVDVGFLDSGSGKIEKRTRFTFKVTRAHGYEAGEYKVTVRDGRNGSVVGTPSTLIFKGQNEIIDRRAMVFSGEKKKKKKDDGEGGEAKAASGDAKPEGGDAKPAGGDDEGSSKKSEDSPSSSSESEGSDSSSSESSGDGDGDEAGTIKEKPGGCGCRLEANRADGTSRGMALLSLLAGLAVLARRRARSNSAQAE
jgi:hypothetical protein